MDIQLAAHTLLKYLDSLKSNSSFVFVDYFDGNYDHMGATISDAILQAGLKYDSVVRPRINRIRTEYADAKTTSAFLKLLTEVGAKTVLDWSDDEKPNRVVGLAEFFLQENIDTEQELRAWIAIESNRPSLLRVRGIGPKTADYIKILVGLETNAPDRHIVAILNEAGIQTRAYEEAREIVNLAADLLKMDRACFDHSIWQYKSNNQSLLTSNAPCKLA